MKASAIFQNDSYSPFSKAMQINQLYRKAAKNRPKKKEIIVAKKFTISAPNKKKGRKFAIVDKRSKKDTRGEKNNLRR